MAHHLHTIPIHVLAPHKPALGAACNGCGVCCLFEPCPVGMVLSRKRTGACVALQWDGALNLYRCGAVQAPQHILDACLPRGLRWSAHLLAPVLRRLAPRWIAAGLGCDSTLELESDMDALPGAQPGSADSTTMPASIRSTGSAPRCDKPNHD